MAPFIVDADELPVEGQDGEGESTRLSILRRSSNPARISAATKWDSPRRIQS